MKLSSAAYLEGYYYKPRLDWELLERHHEGVIATTGCLGGVVLQALLEGDVEKATARAARLQDIFGRDNLFVELQDHGLAEAAPHQPAADRDRPPHRRAAARHQRQPLHPPRRRRRPRRAALRADRLVDGRPQALQVRGRRALPQVGGRDAPAVRRAAGGVRQHAVDRRAGQRRDRVRQARAAVVPAARRLRHRRRVPAPAHPAGRRAALRRDRCPRTVERLDYELGVIADMGFSAYFLVVWDLIRYAREKGIRVGPGAGARRAAAWPTACGIVDLDPIRYDLLFERFLNPGRKQMPDIDMDFDERYRGEMIRYAAETLRLGPRGPDRHVLHDQGPGRGARRRPGARLPLRGRRPHRQGHAAADHGPRHAAARVPRARAGPRRRLQDGRRAARDVRGRPRRQEGHRRGQGPRGPAPPGRHPRRGRGHHPPAAHRVPPDPAQARARQAARSTRPSSRSTRCTASRTSAC